MRQLEFVADGALVQGQIAFALNLGRHDLNGFLLSPAISNNRVSRQDQVVRLLSLLTRCPLLGIVAPEQLLIVLVRYEGALQSRYLTTSLTIGEAKVSATKFIVRYGPLPALTSERDVTSSKTVPVVLLKSSRRSYLPFLIVFELGIAKAQLQFVAKVKVM